MTRYLMYKNKINKMGDKRFPKIASYSSQSHLRIKWGWHIYSKYWINHWGVEKEATLQNNNNIKSIITSKFKEKLWCIKELDDNIKLIYYEVINPNLEHQKYIYILASAKKKINIDKRLIVKEDGGLFLKRCGMK